jgi:hypothetical protein
MIAALDAAKNNPGRSGSKGMVLNKTNAKKIAP